VLKIGRIHSKHYIDLNKPYISENAYTKWKDWYWRYTF